jgi:hypothetical protein
MAYTGGVQESDLEHFEELATSITRSTTRDGHMLARWALASSRDFPDTERELEADAHLMAAHQLFQGARTYRRAVEYELFPDGCARSRLRLGRRMRLAT